MSLTPRHHQGAEHVVLSSTSSGSSGGSVSSLASRFEQLAGNSSSASASTSASAASNAPSLRPVKPPSKLRTNTGTSSSKAVNGLQDVDERTTTASRSRGLSNASNASTSTATSTSMSTTLDPPMHLATATTAATTATRDSLAPPIIPFASRPSLSTPGSFSYGGGGSNGGTTPPASPSRKASKSPPPPVPPPRSVGSSRPGTPSRGHLSGLDVGSLNTLSASAKLEAEDQQDGSVSVAALAARFGSAGNVPSRPTTPKPPPSPARTVSPKPPPPPPTRSSTVTEASSALQQITSQPQRYITASSNPFESPTTSPSIDRAESNNPFESPVASPEKAIHTNGSSGTVYQQSRSPPVIKAPRPISARQTIPALVSAPPTPPPRASANDNEATSVGLKASNSSPGRTTSGLPPTLPARKQSDSALNTSPAPGPGLLPALPARNGPALPARPRSSTLTASPMATATNLALPVSPSARRETVAASTREQIMQEPYLPPPPPTRTVAAGEVPARATAANGSSAGDTSALDIDSDESEGPDPEDPLEVNRAARLGDMPDATFANRRPPRISPERTLSAKHAVNAFGVCGRYAVTATVHVRLWDTYTGESVGVVQCPGEGKLTAVDYVFTDTALKEQGGQISRVWAGTKDGALFEIDFGTMRVLETRTNAHSHQIAGIFRHPGNLVSTVDEAGKVQIWSSSDPKSSPSLSSNPRTNRMGDKHTFVQAFGTQLWSSSGPSRHHVPGQPSAVTRSPSIRIFDVAPTANFALTSRPLFLPENAGAVGAITAGAAVPAQPNIVYLAHESGHVSIWEKDNLTCVSVVRVSSYAITALVGVVNNLWAGNREGIIQVFDMGSLPWTVIKAWKASDEPICGLAVDLGSIAELNKLHVASFGRESMTLWDGTLQLDWLERQMLKNESDFSTFRHIKLLICSWNIDSCKPSDLQGDAVNMNFLTNAIASSIDPAIASDEPPEIIVFSFQEVVDLENKKVTAKSMLLGKKKADQMFSDQVSHQYTRWHDRLSQAIRTAMPSTAPYTVVHAENLVGLLTLIFVRNSEKANLSDIAKISVKTGMGGRYGNKGAICARFVLDDSSICFMNCHLAAGQRAKRQRNKDLIDILENKSAFLQPSSAVPGVYIGGNGQTVFEHELCFLSGDLNYRIDLTRTIVASNIRSNNIGLLLEHDQLLKEMKTNQAFRLRSFQEAEIGFLPTYKFDPGTDNYDSSAKERIPAWCDRILWRTSDPSSQTVQPLQYRSWPATPSDHKPITGLFKVRIKKMQPEKRQRAWQAAEQQWGQRGRALLNDAERYYL